MIRAILVDDENISLELMERRLLEVGGVEIIKTFSDAESVKNELKELNFQAVFLDIEMIGLSGLELAEIIQEWDSSIHIVFVTAFKDYAIQAFELHSIDYLLKPVSKKRLEKTISRIQAAIERKQKEPILQKQITPPLMCVLCFNDFTVYCQEEPVNWKTAKVKELLAFFITHLHTYVNRDVIIHSLWPELDYNKAKILLHTTISHLRKALDAKGYSQALKFSNQSYMLQIDHFYCDAIELEKSIHNLQNLTINEIESTIQLYTGMYLERNGYEWAEKKKQEMNQAHLQLVQKAIDHYTLMKEPYKVIQYLQKFLAYSPYSENALKQLMLMYIELGNRGEAVKVYQEFSTLLQQELGISPDSSTTSLYDSIC